MLAGLEPGTQHLTVRTSLGKMEDLQLILVLPLIRTHHYEWKGPAPRVRQDHAYLNVTRMQVQ